MLVNSMLDPLMNIYPKRINDSRNAMVSSVIYLEQYHVRISNQKRVIHINLDITIQIRNHLNI